jgi:hypothetical protein
MDSSTTPQVVRAYLAQLDAALSDVPDDVRRDIVAGVAEELGGLSIADAAARIEALGDPVFIAAEARAGIGPGPNAEQAPVSTGVSRMSVPAYAVVTVLLIILGGYIVPFVGWAVGLVLLWASPIWSDRDKWAGTLYGPVAGVVGGVLFAVLIAGFNQPSSGALYSWNRAMVAGLILPFFANAVIGVRLLRHAQGRGSAAVVRER